jgi:hypothetical protein
VAAGLTVGLGVVALLTWIATRVLPIPIVPPSDQGVSYTGRVIDQQTGRGVANVRVYLLKPGATYQEWLDAPGFINDRVAAHGVTDERGVYQIAPRIERGRTYVRLVRTPADYPDINDSVTVASSAAGQMDLPDIVVVKSGSQPGGSPVVSRVASPVVSPVVPPTAVPPTLAPAAQTAGTSSFQDFFRSMYNTYEISGRVIDSGTREGVPGVQHLILKPGVVYDDWRYSPGVVNELVIAHGITDQNGAYRTSAVLDPGETYLMIYVTPDEYPTNTTDRLSIQSDTPNSLQLTDVVIRRGS